MNNYILKNYKLVWSITSFYKKYSEEYPYFHGKLYFSSLNKLEEMCNWEQNNSENDNGEFITIIATEFVKDTFNNLDYVPDNY
jgi:hypothetical protein